MPGLPENFDVNMRDPATGETMLMKEVRSEEPRFLLIRDLARPRYANLKIRDNRGLTVWHHLKARCRALKASGQGARASSLYYTVRGLLKRYPAYTRMVDRIARESSQTASD